MNQFTSSLTTLPNGKSVTLFTDSETGEVYIPALNVLDETYNQGPYSYRASAIRWACAHLNQAKRPAVILGHPSTLSALVTEFPHPSNKLEVTDEAIVAFHALYGETTEYQVNSVTGVLQPKPPTLP